MATQTVIQRSFVGGEIAPRFAARADLAKYLHGLRTCRNFVVLPQGGVAKRPGTRFVHETKSSGAVRLVPFIFEGADQTYVLEFGNLYVRFYYHGAIVTTAGPTIYEVVTPYSASEVADIQWTQSADVLTITHPSYAPRQLTRVGHTNWVLTTFTTAPWAPAPTGAAGVAGAAGALTMRYVVTAVKAETFEETYKSNVATIASCAAPTAEAPNTLSWTAVSGATEYNVYCDPTGNGVYGFLSAAKTNAFNDTGIVPDFLSTPPNEITKFASSGNYPRATTYAQQRLWYGGTNTDRERIDGSQVGSYRNYSTSQPLQDDDAVSFVLAGNHLNPVRHLIEMNGLIVGTEESVHAVLGDETGAILPTALNPKQISGVGMSGDVRPVVADGELLFVQARGVKLRALTPDRQLGFSGTDLTVFAPHLFEGYTLVDLAVTLEPMPVVWLVRSDGVLLGLTYLKDQDVWGWHRHQIGGSGIVEACCVIPYTAEARDILYLVVKRTINGSTVRYIETLERMYRKNVDALEDAFYVDSGLTYDGVAASTITGLTHLEGEQVAVLADGVVVSDGSTTSHVVSSGQITLVTPASTVQVGLPIYLPQIETLSLDVDGTAVRGRRKRVQGLQLLIEGTRRFIAGRTESDLLVNRPENWQIDADTVVEDMDNIALTSVFDDHGRVVLRHTDPTPFTVFGILPDVEVGG